MRDVLLIFLILISFSIIALVLFQRKGGGLGAAFGGGGGDGGGGEAYRSKRGVEKLFHYLTMFLAFLFSAVSLSLIFIE